MCDYRALWVVMSFCVNDINDMVSSYGYGLNCMTIEASWLDQVAMWQKVFSDVAPDNRFQCGHRGEGPRHSVLNCRGERLYQTGGR